jgi:2-oxoisovalerate dehydrogenase E2 component (dihydrolipoyl transacylase)
VGHYVIKMPDIGEGIAEVELVKWYVKPGDTVAEEQILADVMTDKANVEIPSNVAGKVVSITGKPGDVVAVGAEIIRLEVEGKGNVAETVAEVKAHRRRNPRPNPRRRILDHGPSLLPQRPR